MGSRITLTKEQERTFRRMWRDRAPVSALCDVLGYTHDTINRLRIRLGLPARTASSRAKRREPKGDPTPAEIEAACAALRAKHLAKRFAEPPTRQYRKDDETYGRVYPCDVFDDEE